MRKRAGRGPTATPHPLCELFAAATEPVERQLAFANTVARFLQRLPQHETVAELLDDFTQTLTRELSLSAHGVFVAEEALAIFVRARCHPSPSARLPESFAADCALVRFFQTAGAPWLDAASREEGDTDHAALRAAAQGQLRGMDQQLAWPLIARERLLGVLMVGPRATGNEYPHREKAVLAWLAATTALTLDRLLDEEGLDLIGRVSRGLAHDIQDLLTPFSTWAQLSAAENFSGERIRSLLPLALRNLELLKERIRHARRLAAEGSIRLERRRLDELVRATVADLEHELNRNDLSVFYGRMPDARVELDEVAIKRVFTNLLVNAITASPRGSQILIEIVAPTKISAQPQWVELTIADQGQGIPPELLKRLQAPAPGRDGPSEPGRRLGLGLAICRQILAAHGGRLDLRSAVGQGTTVTVRVPLTSGHLAAQ